MISYSDLSHVTSQIDSANKIWDLSWPSNRNQKRTRFDQVSLIAPKAGLKGMCVFCHFLLEEFNPSRGRLYSSSKLAPSSRCNRSLQLLHAQTKDRYRIFWTNACQPILGRVQILLARSQSRFKKYEYEIDCFIPPDPGIAFWVSGSLCSKGQ